MNLAGIPPRAGGASTGELRLRLTGHWITRLWERCEMKGRLVAFVGVFCVAILVVSGAYADKPEEPPGKPQDPGTTLDLIIFEGDLEGQAIVEDCCPNAGPNPAYTMTVTRDLGLAPGPVVPEGEYEGFIFMNFFGTKKNQQYYIKFWGSSSSSPGLNVAFGIKGGIIDFDRKSGVLFVDFDGDLLYTLDDETGVLDEMIGPVFFTLERTEL